MDEARELFPYSGCMFGALLLEEAFRKSLNLTKKKILATPLVSVVRDYLASANNDSQRRERVVYVEHYENLLS